MRIIAGTVAFCLVFATGNAFAVQVETYSTSNKSNKDVALVESEAPFSFDAGIDETYVGHGDVERGSISVNNFHENDTRAHFIFTPRTAIGIFRFGVQMERYDFSYSNFAPIPDTLHSTALVIGLDTELSDSFLVRVELDPGFYGTSSDDFGRDTFNVPVIIGGTYIYSSNLQFVFGVGIDGLRKYVVLPGGGVRWKFAPQWTLNAVAPNPRLEYEVNSSFLFYGGADIRATAYRVEKNFGTLRGNPALNHAAISYDEIRIGAGFDWKITSALKFSLEGGAIPFRNYEFHRTPVRYHQDGAAPYGMVALGAAF
jgi:hypothetical protein